MVQGGYNLEINPYHEYINIQNKRKRNKKQYDSPSYKDRSTIVINKNYKYILDKMWEEENKTTYITKREFTNKIIKEYMIKNYPNLL